MKRFSEQLHTKANTVKLQADERRELRARVVTYMEYHPLQVPAVMKSVKSPVQMAAFSPFNMVQIPFSIVLKWSAAAAAFLLVVVPVLAERSIPGDNLYAVKVRFSEEVRSTLTLTSYGKVEWETERISRRIAEVRLLANEGKLTNEVEAEIAAAVKEHTEIVQHEIDVMREDDVDQATLASIQLTTTLELQSASLQEGGNTTLALAMNDVASGNPVQMVVDVINESLSANESQVEAAAIPAYDKIMARVEINTTRAYELLNSLSIEPEDKLRQDLNRRLEDVNRSIEKSKSMRGENEVLASEQLVEVLQSTQKLVVYMSDIEANRAIVLETVVPIIWTEEEQKQELVRASSEIHRKQEILKTVMPKFSINLSEKVAYSLEIVLNNESLIASSTEVAKALNLAKESDNVLTDALLLVEASGIDITTAVIPEELPQATTTPEVLSEESDVENEAEVSE